MAKILIVRLTSLGDVIFTLPLINALEEHEIGYLTSEKGLDVIKDNPKVFNVHFVPIKEWKKRPFSLKTFIEFIQIIRKIRKEKYDIAIDCQQMWKSLFLFMFCGAKRRITFQDAREFSFLAGNEFVKPKAKFRNFHYHIVERNLDFARHLGTAKYNKIKFSLPKPSQNTRKKINELTRTLNPEKPMVIISPATTWVNKHWSNEHWAKVIENIHLKCNLVFTGMESDKQLIDDILEKTSGSINYTNLAGKTNIESLIELFSRANVVISPDSGSANLAWASSKPAVITIFTATPAKRFGPYGDDNKYFSLQAQLPCQPCFKKKCLLQERKNICKHYPLPDEIINIVNNLLL